MRQSNDESIVEDESQATQLLHDLLDPTDSASRLSARDSVQEEDPNLSIVSDLPPRAGGIRYHYHGLAATQTTEDQSQPCEDHEQNGQGPQKPIPKTRKTRGMTSRDGPSQNATRPPSSSSSKTTSRESTRANKPSSLSRGTKSGSATNKVVSFKSPQKVAGDARTTSYSRATFSRSKSSSARMEESDDQSSQDSFAGNDVYQDPAKRLLATSRQFDMPLADLVRVTRSSIDMNDYGGRPSYRMRYPNPRGSSPPEALGNVLVESTPSLSGGSQSQLYDDVESCRQPDYMDLDLPMDQDQDRPPSRQSTEECLSDAASSLYARRDHEGDFFSTKPGDGPATQPSTQVEGDIEMDTSGHYHPTNSAEPPQNTAGSSLPPSRNLLAMINPNKRYRYKKYMNNPAGPQHVQNPTPSGTAGSMAVEATQPSIVDETMLPRRRFPAVARPVASSPVREIVTEETQPSIEEEERAKLPQRQFPPRTVVTSLKSIPSRPHSRAKEDGPPAPVVYDSQPPKEEVDLLMTEESSRGLAKLPPRKAAPLSDTEQDIVPDSMATDIGEEEDKSPTQACHSEEESDEEDSVPLAKIVNQRRAGATGQHEISKAKQPATRKKNVRVKADSKASSAQKTSGRPKGTQEIPSSVPQQDFPESMKAKGTQPATERLNEVPGTRGRSKVKDLKIQTPSSRADEVDEEDVHATESEDGREERGDTTEDETYEERPVDLSKKRKRQGPAPQVAVKDKGKSKTTSTARTPVTRQAKRFRAVASASRAGGKGPTRVFALWRRDGCWYSGTVYSYEGGQTYTVKFDDGTEALLTVDEMRIAEIRVDDEVVVTNSRIIKHHRTCKVAEVSDFSETCKVLIRADEGTAEVEVKSLKIPAKAVSAAWGDRKILQDDIITVIKPEKARASPVSTVANDTGRAARKKLFARTAMIVTMGTPNPGKERDSVMSAIKNNGGIVIDDWEVIIRLEGKHSQQNNQWVIEKKDATWIKKDDIGRVFLLADVTSHKSKFLMALALGIPCVSVAWLRESVEAREELPWPNFLLSHGYSKGLNARPTQQVDADWGSSIHHLKDIMDNKVAAKVFDGLSILCVGEEMVPHPKGKRVGTDDKNQDVQNAVTRIILAMGATRVEAISDLEYASSHSLGQYDFVVIKERQYDSDLRDARVVDWSWVKECLIASRLLPLPDLGQNQESQDV